MSESDRELREPQSAAAPGAPGPQDEATQDQEENVQNQQPSQSGATPPTPNADVGSPDFAPVEGADANVVELQTAVAERTADLQRLQAEYVNYKRRVDRDRELTRQIGTEAVLRDLLDVLDGVSAARAHDELSGGFKSVADNLEKVAARYGLAAFGEAGDPFDPQIHEALMHAHAEDITGPTCVQVLQVGYKVKDKVLRPARVAVAEPEAGAAESAAAESTAGDSATPEATASDVDAAPQN